ncbi:MAG: YraN family protein [Pseudomonadota bacterium]
MSRAQGRAAEETALHHLRSHGLGLIARNWSCRGGELDLVMAEGSTVVVVEVRQRRPSGFATAAESVTPHKQRRLQRATEYFLLRHPHLAVRPLRFDVVALRTPNDQEPDWIRDAFQAAP